MAKPGQVDLMLVRWPDTATKQAQDFVDEWAEQLKVAAEDIAVMHDSETVSSKHVSSAAARILIGNARNRDALGDVLIAVGPLFVGICAGFLSTIGLSSPDMRAAVPIWLYVVSIITLAVSFGVLCAGVTLKLNGK